MLKYCENTIELVSDGGTACWLPVISLRMLSFKPAPPGISRSDSSDSICCRNCCVLLYSAAPIAPINPICNYKRENLNQMPCCFVQLQRENTYRRKMNLKMYSHYRQENSKADWSNKIKKICDNRMTFIDISRHSATLVHID